MVSDEAMQLFERLCVCVCVSRYYGINFKNRK